MINTAIKQLDDINAFKALDNIRPEIIGQCVKERLRRGPKIKIEYLGILPWDSTLYYIILGTTFTDTGARGIMYVRPDALPHKYGME